jgi:hypothetical protein
MKSTVQHIPPLASELTFGERVMQVLHEQRRSKVWLAEQLKISKQNLNYLLKHSARPKHLELICRHLYLHQKWLEQGIGPRYNHANDTNLKIPLLPVSLNQNEKRTEEGATEFIQGHSGMDPACFALHLNNDSMAPEFKAGSILIFDPNRKAQHNDYVCLSLKTRDVIMFRQMIVDGKDTYFKAADPMFRVLCNEPHVVHGVLLESRRLYTPRQWQWQCEP